MGLDIGDFNRSWLEAWTNKDVPALLRFYAEDVVYMDPQTPGGLKGRAALGEYLRGLFAGTPPMRYDPQEVWATSNGYCGRWYCTITGLDAAKTYLRGFDLVVSEDEQIKLNEVYVHPLLGPPVTQRVLGAAF